MQMYLEEFAEKLTQLRDLFGICLDRYEVSHALYPDNPLMQELRTNFVYFFKLFGDTSPLSKRLFTRVEADKDTTKTAHCNDSTVVPSFSLGISQVTPKKLDSVLESIVVAQECDNQKSSITDIVRPRRETKISQICRSPFVSRVVDVSSHAISAEEKRIWEWLFSNKRNKKYGILTFM